MRIEQAPIFPLAPGSFYHDVRGGVVYYALAPAQTEADLQGDAWTSAADVIVAYSNVTGHVWEGVTFQYGSWAQVGAHSSDGAGAHSCDGAGGAPAEERWCKGTVSLSHFRGAAQHARRIR